MPGPTTTGNRRRNDERAAMVQFEIENQRPRRWNPLFNWRKYLKIFGSVFLIILACGAVAYASTAAIWYFFEEHLDITDNSTSSRPKASARTVTRITKPPSTTVSRHSLTSIEPIEASSPILPIQERPDPFRIVGFYDSWSKYEIRGRQLQKLTHVIFSALDMNSAGTLSFHDYGIRKKFIDLVEMSKRVNPSLKIMFSIAEYAYASNFEAVVADPEKKKTLCNSIASLIQTHRIDGVDLFWKWPTKVENRDLFVLLLRDIRQKLNSISDSDHQYILSVVLPNFDWPDFDWPDFILPFFGAHWENVEGPIGVKEEMWFTAKAKTGEETFEGEYIPWREMEGWNLSAAKWHQESRCPFIWLPDERKFLGFENQRSLKEKMKYALEKSLGGITIWSVEMDDDSDTLLNSVQV